MAEKRPHPETSAQPEEAVRKSELSPAAKRALAEAEERREAARAAGPREKEFGGPKGPEPVRYGDWELKGRAIDF